MQEKQENYVGGGMGEFPEEEWDRILGDSGPILQEFLDCKRKKLNKKLISGAEFTPEESTLLRSVKGFIGKFDPKPRETDPPCFFAAKLSPIEIWRLEIKGKFYLSNFLIGTTDFDLAKGVDTNVIFEVDTTQFNDYSLKLTDYIYLISCYNVYEWEGCRTYESDGQTYFVIKLRVLNYHFQNCNNKIGKVPRQKTLSQAQKPYSELGDDRRRFLDRSLKGKELYDVTKELYTLYPITTSPLDKSPVQPKGRPTSLVPEDFDDKDLLELLKFSPDLVEEASRALRDRTNLFRTVLKKLIRT